MFLFNNSNKNVLIIEKFFKYNMLIIVMLLSLISFLGLVVGFFLPKFTKDELKSGYKWFKVFEVLMLLSVIVAGLLYTGFEMPWFLLIFLGMLFGWFFKNIYFYFGILIASLFSYNLMFGLIFIYGVPYGTLIYIKNKGHRLWNEVMKYFIIFLIPLVIVKYFLVMYSVMLSYFALGALLILFFRILRICLIIKVKYF